MANQRKRSTSSRQTKTTRRSRIKGGRRKTGTRSRARRTSTRKKASSRVRTSRKRTAGTRSNSRSAQATEAPVVLVEEEVEEVSLPETPEQVTESELSSTIQRQHERANEDQIVLETASELTGLPPSTSSEGIRANECDCGATFATPLELGEHISVEHGRDSLVCCGKQYDSPANFAEHRQAVHGVM